MFSFIMSHYVSVLMGHNIRLARLSVNLSVCPILVLTQKQASGLE